MTTLSAGQGKALSALYIVINEFIYLFRPIYQTEQELLDLHEGKPPTQNRWNNKSPFKRQRRN